MYDIFGSKVLNTFSTGTNSTGVYGFHFLIVYLSGRSGVMTYKVREMITVESNRRDSDRDLT